MSGADRRPRPVLVTGVHKSGTTWVGRALGAHRNIGYIHEPFNLSGSAGVCSAPFRYWYTYICDDNAAPYTPHLARSFAFRYSVRAELSRAGSWRDVARLVRDCSAFAVNRARGARPLVKDPLAALSSDWLARTFGMQVVVVVRDPLGLAGSLKVRGANHPFSHFLAQPLLMRDHLSGMADEIRWAAEQEIGPVDQAILLWRIVYSVLLEFRRRHPKWIFVYHEDLCADPVGEYGRLFDRLGWKMGPRAEAWIARTAGLNGRWRRAWPRVGRDRFLYRRSRAALESWSERLDSGEIRRVRERTAVLTAHLYGAARE